MCHTCVKAIIQYQIKFFQAKLWKTKEQYFNLISYTNHSKFWKLRNKYFTEITLWKIQKQYFKLIFQTNHSKLWKITETIAQITQIMKNYTLSRKSLKLWKIKKHNFKLTFEQITYIKHLKRGRWILSAPHTDLLK